VFVLTDGIEMTTWLGSLVDMVVPLLTVLTPLVAVPLTIITFYLRSLREEQVSWHAELVRRLDSVEGAVREQRSLVRAFERDYTTKEEWLREYMYTRQTLGQLRESTVRLDATLKTLAREAGS
jgi:hypothetical protein